MIATPAQAHMRDRRRAFGGLMRLALATVVLAGCGRRAVDVTAPDGAPHAWRALFQGVHFMEVAQTDPAPLRVYALRIDLRDPGVGFIVSPSNGEAPGETDSANTSTFLARHRCQAAINGSPFAPVVDREGHPQDVQGLSLSNGDLYSDPSPRHGSLLIDADNTCRIVAPPVDPADAVHGLGGFAVILKDGRNIGATDSVHPRSAVGISRDGRFLLLMVIDGRQPGFSEGATTADAAQWLLRLGAWQGLNLDGGGSSALVVADELGRPRLLNSPIHKGIPGNERPSANHLGVYARPLP